MRDTAVYTLLARWSFRYRQFLYLLCSTIPVLFLLKLTGNAEKYSTMELTLAEFIAIALIEFLVCWLAADHIFGFWKQMQSQGLVEELKVTLTSPAEVFRDFIRINWIFLGPSIALLCIIAGLLIEPFNPEGSYPNTPRTVMRGITFILCLIAIILTDLYTASALSIAATVPEQVGRIEKRWASTLSELGLFLGSTNLLIVLSVGILKLAADHELQREFLRPNDWSAISLVGIAGTLYWVSWRIRCKMPILALSLLILLITITVGDGQNFLYSLSKIEYWYTGILASTLIGIPLRLLWVQRRLQQYPTTW